MNMPESELLRVPVGSLMPSFTLQTVEGDEFSTWDFKGRKNLVILVMGKVCNQDCRNQLVNVAREYKHFKDMDAEVVAIFRMVRENAGDIVSELNLPYPALIDVDGMVTGRLVYHTPAVLVADRYGEVVEEHSGEDALRIKPEQLLARVELNELACPE